MDQWIEIASKFGIPVVMVAMLALFIYKQVWPFITKQIEEAKQERVEMYRRNEEQGRLFTEALKLEREDNARRFEDQGKLFMESLRQQNVLAADTQTRVIEELKSLNHHIRNGK